MLSALAKIVPVLPPHGSVCARAGAFGLSPQRLQSRMVTNETSEGCVRAGILLSVTKGRVRDGVARAALPRRVLGKIFLSFFYYGLSRAAVVSPG